MEAPKTIVTPKKKKDFSISKENDNFTLSLIYTCDILIFSLIHKNKSEESLKYEKCFSPKDLNNILKWWRLFDSLHEVYENIIKIIEKNQLSIN